MKNILSLPAYLILLLAVFCTYACSQSAQEKANQAQKDLNEAKQELKEDLNDAAAQMRREQIELREDLQHRKADIDRKIEEMDQKMEKASKQAKADWAIRKAKLQADKQRLDGYIARTGEDIKDGWNEFRADVNEAIQEIQADLKD